jgi:hypothetical protein
MLLKRTAFSIAALYCMLCMTLAQDSVIITTLYSDDLQRRPAEIILGPKYLTVISFFADIEAVNSARPSSFKAEVDGKLLYLNTTQSTDATDVWVRVADKLHVFNVRFASVTGPRLYQVHREKPTSSPSSAPAPIITAPPATPVAVIAPPPPVAPRVNPPAPPPLAAPTVVAPPPPPAPPPPVAPPAPPQAATVNVPPASPAPAPRAAANPLQVTVPNSLKAAMTASSVAGITEVSYTITNASKVRLSLEPFNLRVTQEGVPLSFKLNRSSSAALEVNATATGSIGVTRKGSGTVRLEWMLLGADGTRHVVSAILP